MPVTIITGFLGSGKTTLLNQILKNKQDLKVAVLVNEFGDINIDSQLLVSLDQDMVELSNGCICCTINDGLFDAVYRILERQDKIDYWVIETTGIADPLPIILTFVGSELRDLTRLDSVLTLVDTSTFTPEHFDSEAALKQVAFGDIVLLNKTDLTPPEKIEELESYIRTVKVGARMLRSQYGEVPLPLILDVELTEPGAYQEYESAPEEHEHHEHHNHHDHEHHEHHEHEHEHHHHEHHHHHSDHLQNDGFISVSFQSDRPFAVKKFETFLTEKVSNSVFRAKGILWFAESEARHVFQLSGPRYDLNQEDWLEPPKNQLVLIGRNLDPDQLKAELTACLV
ncbi:CobW family GTP-binding protein [Laspinema palackyanum]|uniref:CobW family GTP-binding protein n=1 Tax=Laspinema palackyanum TaxID=3231601 RepID=UPI00345DA5DE|nr:GTP-binding protein [Laspinema sp. D2c]